MDKKLIEIFEYLTENLKQKISKISEEKQNKIREIRLRSNREICLVFEKNLSFIQDYKVSVAEIEEIFKNMCQYSIYSFQNQIRNGFITLKSGHRVGISGTAVTENGKIQNIKNISSLNIRISREIFGCSEKIYKKIKNLKSGVLLAGPPLSGKTTILRDLARIISKQKKVTLLDERSEIAAIYGGIPQCDVGYSDILDMYPKSEGILQAIRTLSPEFLICDEIGSLTEAEAIIQSLNSGVQVIISIHASDIKELIQKPQAKKLLKTGAFSKIIFLGEHDGENFRIFNFDDNRRIRRTWRCKKA